MFRSSGTAQLIADVTGAVVSTGWVASLLPAAADLVTDSLNLIRALLVMGHVLHADETTTRTGATRRWPHVACTDFLTLPHSRTPGPPTPGPARI
ncbi:transposase [Streptomyces violaceusniger]|uniref:IS66 family transposase n=1 Tax=Streptomyces violaceusniger TaxID=68280 RepID=UPI0009C3C882|nr:transposase [Streptomyces hygroscopicus]